MKPVILSHGDIIDLLARRRQGRPITQMRDAPAQRDTEKRKYSNVRVTDGGMTFDSKAEHRRWVYLQHMAKAGHITQLRCQVPFELIPAQVSPSGKRERPTTYVADFVYLDDKGSRVVEDVKGASTPEYRLKRKLLLWRHGIEIQEIRS